MYKQKYQKQTSKKTQETYMADKERARQQGKVTTWKIWKFKKRKNNVLGFIIEQKQKKKG